MRTWILVSGLLICNSLTPDIAYSGIIGWGLIILLVMGFIIDIFEFVGRFLNG